MYNIQRKMKLKSTILGLLMLAFVPAFALGVTNSTPIRTVAELQALRNGDKAAQRDIDLTVTVVSKIENTIIVQDETGRADINQGTKLEPGQSMPQPGDLVRIKGDTLVNERQMHWDSPRTITVLGHTTPPEPFAVRIDQIDPVRDDLRFVVFDGTVISSFKDEIDSRYQILIVKDGHDTLPVYVARERCPNADTLELARIRVTGTFYHRLDSYRFLPQSSVISQRIDVLTPPATDPFDVAELTSNMRLSVKEINDLVHCKVTGRVLATWANDRLMLGVGLYQSRYTLVCLVRLHPGLAFPPVGASVTLAGKVEADFFSIAFENAVWRLSDTTPAEETEEPKDVKATDIRPQGTTGRLMVDTSYQGALVRTAGQIISVSSDRSTLTLDGDGVPFTVDTSTLSGLDVQPFAVGAKLRVTGRCLLETSKKSNFSMFPQIQGFKIIVRSPADVEVLAQPPWWTPGRLFGAILVLLAILLGLSIWNRTLNRLVQRRGKELAKAEIDKASSELRIAERTRLAVELHDSISQNLTGIALAINAGEMQLADKSLKSCREELRNCLWDLRSNALEEFDINEAIRKTLAPNLMSAKLNVRFRLARNTISDTTTYTILRIIRELAVNGIRHGGATLINVAGSIEEGRILFSVQDNGCGFDPDQAPGVDEGHFGLEGVRERVSNLNGEVKIESSPNNGTKVTICLQKPKS